MEIRDVLPLILWPWFLVSVFILGRRAVRRRFGAGSADTPAGPEATRPAGPTGAIGPAAPAGPPSGPAGAGPPSRPIEPWPTAPPTPPTPRPQPVLPDGASIFDAPTDLPPAPPQASIAEMVEGIRLPCDLTPLVGAMRPIGARESVAFVTRNADAATVGRAMGEELRRLGFELTTRHATEVVAARGDDWLIVTVHADGEAAERSGERPFPNAGPGSVVVELWTE